MGLLPFRALRFAEGIDLAAATAPPYDAIDPGEVERLLAAPHNVAHLTLAAGDAAAGTLDRWRREGVLRPDPASAIYLERESFEHGGRVLEREVLHGLVPLDPRGGAPPILFHERTVPRVVEAQEAVLERTGTNLDSTLLLYEDEDGRVGRALGPLRLLPPLLSFREAGGTRHELRRVEDPGAAAAVSAALGSDPLLIADGHHRMEAAMRFAAGRGAGRAGSGLRLVGLVHADGPGLLLLPTHRVLGRPGGRGLDAVREEARREGIPCREVPRAEVEARLRADRAAVAAVAAGGATAWVVSCPSGARGAAAFVAERVLPALGNPVPEVRRDLASALALLDDGAHSLALLQSAPKVDDVRVAADAGLPMPPKSTCFWPKLLSGILLRAMDEGTARSPTSA